MKNNFIVVTGASGSIGRAVAVELGEQGANLALVARRRDSLEKTKQLVEKGGGSAKIFPTDLTDTNATKKLIEQIKKEANVVDALINIAGVGAYKHLGDITEKDWDKSFSLNVKAVYMLTLGLLPLLEKSPLSLVLNLGSGVGIIPMRGRSLYCASKFALRGFTLSLAEEYKDGKPDFCLITLGSTLTPFGPLSLEEKKRRAATGKAYFPLEWVSNKLVEIIQAKDRETEYTLFPSDYGFGEWKKP